MRLHHENRDDFDFIVPEFVDIHCHGGGGAYFWEDSQRARSFHRENGTGIQVASLVTLSPEDTKQALTKIAVQEDIFGIHLEGPYISKDFCGAHQSSLIRDPDMDELSSFIEIAQGKIVMVTVAPERPGALQAIEFLVSQGIIVAIGHSAADASTTRAAIEAGATVVTHFNNGMAKLGTPNSLNEVALKSQLFLELIPDNLHLSPDDLEKILGLANDRCIAITDAMSAAGSPDGKYQIGSLEVVVRNGEARLASTGKLAGSTLSMLDAFFNIQRSQGVERAVEMTSTTPRKILGIREATRYIGIKGRTVTYLD